MSNVNLAATAYQAAQRLLAPTRNGAGVGQRPAGQSFGDLLGQAVQQMTNSTRATDNQAQRLVAGRADLIDVVTAVAETEVAVEAMVSIRDRVVQSYEEIMRMQI